MSGWLLLVNQNARRAAEPVITAVADVLRAAGPVETVITARASDVPAALDRVGDRVLVMAGGDGTIHHVVERLWSGGRLRDTVMGFVPIGTCNDVVTGLGLPGDTLGAARHLVEASPVERDLLVAGDGTVAVNSVHLGLGAKVVTIAAPLKSRLGRFAFPLGAAVGAIRQQGWRMSVVVDGSEVVPPGERVLFAAAANLPTIGGGIPLCPGARADDGRLDVVVALDRGRLGRPGLGTALRTGRHVERADVVTATGTEVRFHGDAVGHDADGEVVPDVTDRIYRVVSGAWRVLA